MKRSMKQQLASLVLSAGLLFGSASTASAASYTDVTNEDWYKGDVEFVTDYGLMSGFQDGSFRPHTAVTRAQIAKVLNETVEQLNITQTISKPSASFTDVRADKWYTPHVETLASYGVINGIGDGTYRPDRTVTRSEFAVMLSKAFHMDQFTGGIVLPFRDVSPNAWYAPAVGALTRTHVTRGETGLFFPQAPLTRSELAVFMSRAITWYEAVKAGKVVKPSEFTQREAEEAFLQSVNGYREAMNTKHGKRPNDPGYLHPVKRDETLHVLASKRVEQIKIRFDHVTPSGLPVDDWIGTEGYKGSVGENIAYGYETLDHVLEAWKKSPGHNAPLLNPATTQIGFAHTMDGKPHYVLLTSSKPLQPKR